MYSTAGNSNGFSQVVFGESAESLSHLLHAYETDSTFTQKTSDMYQSSLVCGLRTLLGLKSLGDTQSMLECTTWPFVVEESDQLEITLRVASIMERVSSTNNATVSNVRHLTKKAGSMAQMFLSHVYGHMSKMKQMRVCHVVLAVSPSLSTEHVANLKSALSAAGFLRVDCLLSPFAVVLAYLEFRQRKLKLDAESEDSVSARASCCSTKKKIVPSDPFAPKTFLVVYWGASNADVSCVKSTGSEPTAPLRLVGVEVARNCGGCLLTEKLVYIYILLIRAPLQCKEFIVIPS